MIFEIIIIFWKLTRHAWDDNLQLYNLPSPHPQMNQNPHNYNIIIRNSKSIQADLFFTYNEAPSLYLRGVVSSTISSLAYIFLMPGTLVSKSLFPFRLLISAF